MKIFPRPPFTKPVLRVLAAALLLYLSGCGWLYWNQSAFLYYPTPRVEARGADEIVLKNDAETLRIWRVGPIAGDAVVYFGGNAQDVAQNIPLFAKTFPGKTVYLVNYRGYGGSSGAPSEAALLSDALALFDHVRPLHANISAIGQSLGSGVAAYLASQREIARVVLITPYDSIENVARAHFRFYPVSLLLKDKYDSAARVRAIKTPALIILAEQDDIIPHARSHALAAAFQASKPEIKVVPGSDHNTVCASEDDCLRWLREFL